MDTMVRDGLGLLEGLEEGNSNTLDIYNLTRKLDPVLVSLVIRYLRKKYPSTRPEAAGVMGRLVDLTSTYPNVVKETREAEADPISEWFVETYNFPEFYGKPEEMIQLIVDKLEG